MLTAVFSAGFSNPVFAQDSTAKSAKVTTTLSPYWTNLATNILRDTTIPMPDSLMKTPELPNCHITLKRGGEGPDSIAPYKLYTESCELVFGQSVRVVRFRDIDIRPNHPHLLLFAYVMVEQLGSGKALCEIWWNDGFYSGGEPSPGKKFYRFSETNCGENIQKLNDRLTPFFEK